MTHGKDIKSIMQGVEHTIDENLKHELDVVLEKNLETQRKIRKSMKPLLIEFITKNYDRLKAFELNQSDQVKEEEISRIGQLAQDFCKQNLEGIISLLLEAESISLDDENAVSYVYMFQKSFPISFKEELINSLEIQRESLAEIKRANIVTNNH